MSERRLAVVGIMLCMFLAALDQTIVATALPRIVGELRGLDRYAWVATGYLLASVVALPVFGRWTEMAAGKWVLLVASSVFLLGSFLCGLRPPWTPSSPSGPCKGGEAAGCSPPR